MTQQLLLILQLIAQSTVTHRQLKAIYLNVQLLDPVCKTIDGHGNVVAVDQNLFREEVHMIMIVQHLLQKPLFESKKLGALEYVFLGDHQTVDQGSTLVVEKYFEQQGKSE